MEVRTLCDIPVQLLAEYRKSDQILYRDGGASGNLTILPNSGLVREKLLRAGMTLRVRLLGNDLALDAGVRRLTDGITWAPSVDNPDSGLHFFGPSKNEPDVPQVVWSQGESITNRYWFPCFDNSTDRYIKPQSVV